MLKIKSFILIAFVSSCGEFKADARDLIALNKPAAAQCTTKQNLEECKDALDILRDMNNRGATCNEMIDFLSDTALDNNIVIDDCEGE